MKDFIKRYKYFLIVGLFILIFLIVIIILAKDMFFSSNGDVYGNRLDGISEYEVSKEDIAKVEEEITKEEKVNSAKVRVQGKIIYITIDYVADISIDNAKEIATKSLQNFSDEIKSFYDFQYLLTQEENEDEEENSDEETIKPFPSMGSKNISSTTIVWVNS